MTLRVIIGSKGTGRQLLARNDLRTVPKNVRNWRQRPLHVDRFAPQRGCKGRVFPYAKADIADVVKSRLQAIRMLTRRLARA